VKICKIYKKKQRNSQVKKKISLYSSISNKTTNMIYSFVITPKAKIWKF